MDAAIEAAGPWGKYQKRGLLFNQLISFFVAVSIIGGIFVFPAQKHRCALPDWPNDTFNVQSDAHMSAINRSVPWDEVQKSFSQCFVYRFNDSDMSRQQQNCTRWVFDRSVYGYTLTEELNLVCSNAIKRSTLQMIIMIGMLSGTFVCGQLSDAIGRIKTQMIGVSLSVVTAIGSYFVKSFWTFAVTRLLFGMFSSVAYLACYVMGIEIVGAQYRTLIGTLNQFYFSLGVMAAPLIAYFTTSWNVLSLSLYLPIGIILLTPLLLWEPARWLISHGKHEEAHKQLKRIAKINGCSSTYYEMKPLNGEQKGSSRPSKTRATILDLFKSRPYFIRVLTLAFIWVVNTLVYYGLSMNAASLVGSPHLNVALSGVVEGVGIISSHFLMHHIGRKWPLCVSMLVAGIMCILTIFPILFGNAEGNLTHQWVIIVLSLLGKLGISCSFNIIYLFTAELAPTVVRNTTVGVCAMVSRVGGIIAPYIADLATLIPSSFGPAVPLIIFGSFSLVAGALSITLPETRSKDMSDTLRPTSDDDTKADNESKAELL